MNATVRALLNLTKPRISLLFAVSGLAALVIEASTLHQPLHFWFITLAIFCVGGSANAFNQYFEREIDAQMERTAKKRPLPLSQLSPRVALAFAVLLGILGNFMLWRWGTALAVILGVLTILYYSFYYTLWLKPRTPYNIVIGGAAGATGPLIAWAAVTGHLALMPFLLFLLIFFWTPPHFWALALFYKDDYTKVGYPMLPNVAGDAATRKQILLYSFTLLPIALGMCIEPAIGWIYGLGASVLSITFLWLAYQLYRRADLKSARNLFAYSILYLMLLLLFLIADGLI